LGEHHELILWLSLVSLSDLENGQKVVRYPTGMEIDHQWLMGDDPKETATPLSANSSRTSFKQ
jgi:hypothetical protein